MTTAEIEMYANLYQRDRRAAAAAEARVRSLAPGPFERLLAALRPQRTERSADMPPVRHVGAAATAH